MGEWAKKCGEYCCIPQRVIVAIMGFLAIVNAYTMRISISVAIVQLVVPINRTEKDTESGAVCKSDVVETSDRARSGGGTYEWSEEMQGIILGSFYIGYIVTHVPGGMLADKYGCKWVLGLGIFITGLLTILTPMAIRLGDAPALIVLRILMGAGEGTTFPALSVLLSHWAPPSERGTLGALVLGGGQIGTVVTNAISGVLLYYFIWDWTFYFWGFMAIVWFIVFVITCYNDPISSPFITQRELDYLEEQMGSLKHNRDLPPPPIKAIMTNVPFLTVICAQIGHDWGFYVVVSYLPKFMADVIRISIRDNGFLTSLPYVAMWFISIGSGFVTDKMINAGWITRTFSRKFCTVISAIGPSIFLIWAGYGGCDKHFITFLFCMAMLLMGFWYAGMKLSPLDLSPNYAGTLMAITNGIGAITGWFAPLSVGYMTPNATLFEWRMVLWTAFAVLSLSCVPFGLFGSGNVQDFNEPKT